MLYEKHIPKNIIRDISWLSFNERVLQEAMDEQNHIYDRIKFLGIFSNNQDEFFRVRVATLKRMVAYGKKANVHLEENPQEILSNIYEKVAEQQLLFNKTFTNIIRQLKERNIHIKNHKQLNKAQKQFVHQYFDEKIMNDVVPVMIESIPGVPFLKDKSIYLACTLRRTDNPSMHRYALIEVPTSHHKRFVLLPSEEGEQNIILLEDIIKFNLPHIFGAFGYDHYEGHIIKVTKDAELDIDNDINSNIIAEIEKGLKNRKKGKATRFIYDKQIDDELLMYLKKRLGFSNRDIIIKGGSIHNFKDFMDFPASVFHDITNKNKPFTHPLLEQPCRIFDVLDQRDVMLHLPYHSFDSVIDLLREAAIDPHVKSIKITGYRLASNSTIVNALINAVRNGKHVAVHLELRARFDEENNLKWKRVLEDEGVHVYVGLPHMKVHAKLCIIKKVVKNKISNYGFISTGNFNENTARFYGDECLLTANKKILQDVNNIFEYLEAPEYKAHALKKCKTLPVSPLTMRTHFIKLIEDEIKLAKRKKPAKIIIKLNSLVDQVLIGKLYEAAHFGVEVNLIIRGICCAITRNKWFKQPINAISIVDEYLEHARIFVFFNGGQPKIYTSSADWMVRNLDHRVEAALPILDPIVQQEILDMLHIELSGNVKARILDNKQRNKYVERHDDTPMIRSQKERYQYLKNQKYN